MTNRPHALYRFYSDDGALLYVGITFDPGARWRQHRDDKPWWTEVANVTVETHPDRASVLEAERQAILAERPRYNVIHNRGTGPETRAVPQLDRLEPFQPGDWVALGLLDGRCPVGEIAALNSEWVSIRLKDFFDGCISHHTVAVRWADVARVELAYPEDATPGSADPFGAARVMDDRHLGDFQTAWERTHLGDEKEPVDHARAEVRRENAERRARRS